MRLKLRSSFVTLIILLAGAGLCAQPDARGYKKQADQFFNLGKYQEALQQYLLQQTYDPNDLDTRFKIGVCYYETSKLNDARRNFSELLDGGKYTDPQLYYYLGLCAHASNQFLDAIHYYKDYLRRIEDSNPRRAMVKDRIRRCAYGLRIQQAKSNIIVENLGKTVNSPGNDFRPIPSPSSSDKIYFSSAREGNAGGLRNETGKEDNAAGKFTSDMFSVSFQQGLWLTPTALSYLLNSAKNDVLLDFNQDGTQLYYFQGSTLFSGDVLVDTFRTRPEERSLFSPIFKGPIRSWEGDCDPHFFQDTILLFSSNRPGGYGGFDIYLSIFSKGYWSEPENLGPVINSHYDERSPFLALDGRTLYFSTTNPNRSLGGFDVVRAYFEDASESWQEPWNPGVPVNSADDDLHFRLTRDGMKAYFSSNRRSGMGQNDIYAAFFRESQREQLRTSTPLVFSQVRDFKLSFARKTGIVDDPAAYFPEDQIEKYFLEPLYYDPNGEILTGRNMKTLGVIGDLMLRFPQIRVMFTSHSDGTDPDNVDHFFSAKRAEAAIDYLARRGVNIDHLLFRAMGDNYPKAQPAINNAPNPTGQQINRRIDIAFLNTSGLPLRIRIKEPNVPEQMATPSWDFFAKTSQGLSYKLQIATTSQMYSGELFFRYPHAMIEKDPVEGDYLYTVGLYKTFNSARQLQQDLIRNGAIEYQVVPYLDGVRLDDTEAGSLLKDYPDLQNYLQR